ncbi:MAG: hypothetical protein FJX71_01700 [Alphaproteobacteria bacterium]|nr:hypothetical protein [Alphaproteobacteria bacterium]
MHKTLTTISFFALFSSLASPIALAAEVGKKEADPDWVLHQTLRQSKHEDEQRKLVESLGLEGDMDEVLMKEVLRVSGNRAKRQEPKEEDIHRVEEWGVPSELLERFALEDSLESAKGQAGKGPYSAAPQPHQERPREVAELSDDFLIRFALEDSLESAQAAAAAAPKPSVAPDQKLPKEPTDHDLGIALKEETDKIYERFPFYQEMTTQLRSLEQSRGDYEANGTLDIYKKDHGPLEKQKQEFYELHIKHLLDPTRLLKNKFPYLAERKIKEFLETIGLL